MNLTKDSEKMLCCLYKEYMQRVKNGASKSSSKSFTMEYTDNDDILSTWHKDDVGTTRNTLKRIGFLKVHLSGNFELTDAGISYMENRFKNNMVELTNFISQFVP